MCKSILAFLKKPSHFFKQIYSNYRNKIAINILIFSFIPVLILGIFVTVNMWNKKVAEILTEYQNELNTYTLQTEERITQINEKINYIKNNLLLINTLSNEDQNNNLLYYESHKMLKNIFRALEVDQEQDNIRIYSFSENNVGSYIYPSIYLDKKLKEEIILSNKSLLWKTTTENDTTYLCSYSKIMSLEQQPLAIIEYKLLLKSFFNNYNIKLPPESFIIYHTDNFIEILNRKNITDDNIINTFHKHLSIANSKYHSLKVNLSLPSHNIFLFIPKSVVFKELKSFVLGAILITVSFIIIIIFLVNIISSHLTERLSDLLAEIDTDLEKIISTNTINHPILNGNDEFSKIENKFFTLIKRIKNYYQQINEYQKEKKQLEIKLLQDRINPHFLYNTLSALNWVFPNPELQKIVKSMVKYYRIVLNKGSEVIKIKKEIELIEEYIKLQQFAYDSNFKYLIEVDDLVKNQLILKQLLQPIVENAILHGVNALDTGGILKITINMVNNHIVFKVSDNGPGIEEKTLNNIMISDNNIYSGYGLKNVQKRIKLYYGNRYGFKINSKSYVKTIVSFSIPANTENNFSGQKNEY